MPEIFNNIFADSTQTTISAWKFLLCIGISLLTGIMYLFAASFRSRTTSSFRYSLALLPSVVCVVIMMVNGNIGIGVAIAGAFSLVRFRSAQGSAKEISLIFMTMCSGLIAGVGYLAYALLFTVIMCLISVAGNIISAKAAEKSTDKTLKITIPEDFDYNGLFDDLLNEYTISYRLKKIRTTNMGTMFELQYIVCFKELQIKKEFFDEIRTRNGNLNVIVDDVMERESL